MAQLILQWCIKLSSLNNWTHTSKPYEDSVI